MIEITIPSMIEVGGFDYSIVSDIETDKELEAESAWGQHSQVLKRIRLCSVMSSQQCSSTVIHELLHAVSDECLSEGLNEGQVKGLTHGLLQVFKQLGVGFVKPSSGVA